MAASDLFDLMAEWLSLCEDAVATTFGGAIDRAFVANSLPALDCCPQLAVYAGSAALGDTLPLAPPLAPGQRGSGIPTVPLIAITCCVVRCSPSNDEVVQDADTLERVARETSEDLWAIWNWTLSKHRSNELFQSGGGKRELFLDPAAPVNTSGGCAGWLIPIRVALGGYRPPDGS